MESQAAEIASPAGDGKVDSDPTNAVTEGSAPSAAEAGAADGQAVNKPQSPEKKRDEGQERFDKLTRDLYELRSELDRGRYEREARDKRVQELEAELATAKRSQVAPDNPPTLEQFGYDEAKYQAALVEHLSKSLEGTLLERLRGEFGKVEQAKAEREMQSTWSKREADFAKSNPDYVDKVKNDRTLPISAEMAREIMQMEMGPQIAYYLAENREKAGAIAKLPPTAQLRELGRIEGLLEAKKSTPKPPVSQAPPPAAKIEATDAPTSIKVDTADSDQLSDREWTRRRNAQEAARLRKLREG